MVCIDFLESGSIGFSLIWSLIYALNWEILTCNLQWVFLYLLTNPENVKQKIKSTEVWISRPLTDEISKPLQPEIWICKKYPYFLVRMKLKTLKLHGLRVPKNLTDVPMKTQKSDP